MKQGRYCALALGCALLLTGCESWRRLPSPDAPKEVTAASIWQQEEEQPDGQQEQDAGGLAVEQSTATDMLSASITARGGTGLEQQRRDAFQQALQPADP